MRRMFGAAAIVVVLGACGPKKGPDGGGGGGSGGTGGDTAGADAGDGTGTASAAVPLTRAECEKMIDHVLAIGMEEQRKNKPTEYVPTEAQVADIRAKMVADQMDECLAWPRPVWECTIAAPTIDALYRCAEGESP